MVTILILIDGFLQYVVEKNKLGLLTVTILILIDGFLQSNINVSLALREERHNPYFNRWFSAIDKMGYCEHCNDVTILILIDGFLQLHISDNSKALEYVTILILIDGFLQY